MKNVLVENNAVNDLNVVTTALLIVETDLNRNVTDATIGNVLHVAT